MRVNFGGGRCVTPILLCLLFNFGKNRTGECVVGSVCGQKKVLSEELELLSAGKLFLDQFGYGSS